MNICYKTTTFLPSEGAISDCFQPFPLGHLWTFKKKTALRGNGFFLKKCGLDKFWPDHVSDHFRPFPLSLYIHTHTPYTVYNYILIYIYMYMYIFNSAYMYVHVHTLKTTMWLAFVHRWLLLAACAEKPHVLSKDR